MQYATGNQLLDTVSKNLRSLRGEGWKARRRSRHRSAETFAGYVRAAEEWTDSGLKGAGF
jgi:hypothetical protein